MTNFRDEVISSETTARGQRLINSLSTGKDDAVDFTDDKNFFNAINTNVKVDRVRVSKGRHGVALESFSRKWLISTEAERRLTQHTTQRGIREILHPSL